MQRFKQRLMQAGQRWAPYAVVLLVFAGFVGLVTWDFLQHRSQAPSIGVDGEGALAGPSPDGGREAAAPDEATPPTNEVKEADADLRELPAFPDQLDVEPPLQEVARTVRVHVLADGLSAPDGLALDPDGNGFYFTEEDRATIWRVDRDGQRTVAVDSHTPLSRAEHLVPEAPVRGLEGIALHEGVALYAVEDVPGGRILRFPLDAQGGIHAGEVLPLPGSWEGFAWEAVAVSSDGRLLVGGSNAEQALSKDGGGVFVGVVLYRDREEQWWLPHERMFESVSSVAFSKSQRQAVYVCEISGEVGWIDLVSRRPTGGSSRWMGKTPEGLAVLPNGALLVAEEGGSLWIVDPGKDHAEKLTSGLGSLETVAWDASAARVLAVDDAQGRVLAVHVEPGFDAEEDRMVYARYEPLFNLVHVPEQCPEYLVDVLALGGLDYRSRRVLPMPFREFTQRVPLIAADVVAEPSPEAVVPDPIERMQLVVFEPNRILNAESGPSAALSGFYARTRSGKVIRTASLRMLSSVASFPEWTFEPAGETDMVVPNAAAVTVSAAGIATLQFLGLGRTPDFFITLNPLHPESSSMIVQDLAGASHSYRLRLPGTRVRPDNWVVAYSRQLADEWKRLVVAEPVLGGK